MGRWGVRAVMPKYWRRLFKAFSTFFHAVFWVRTAPMIISSGELVCGVLGSHGQRLAGPK